MIAFFSVFLPHDQTSEQQVAQFSTCIPRDLLSKTPQLFPSSKMMLGILAWG